MSIINDALKKAEKRDQPSRNKPFQILEKLDEIATDAKRFVLRRWLIWTGTGIACLLGTILAINSFKSPAQKTISNTKAPPSSFQLEKIEPDTSGEIRGFRLSGILYDKENPLAIINGRVLEEGALINEAKLLEIQPNYVKLSLRGEELKLKVK